MESGPALHLALMLTTALSLQACEGCRSTGETAESGDAGESGADSEPADSEPEQSLYDQVCQDEAELACPDDMTAICGAFCMDLWEASRLDASEKSGGSDGTLAVSQAGVIPWYSSDGKAGMNQQIATAACEAAGKQLCSPEEWQVACAGADELSYCYGDKYVASTCNGIDAFCDCDGDGEPDGEDAYAGCRYECDTDLRVVPTGSFPDCIDAWGVFDINGNVWEVVRTDDGHNHYRGGAYNCSDSEALHKCDYDGQENGGFPSAKGFRCCADGELAP